MEQSKTTAKDFFLHLGAIAALYAVSISFVNLLFSVINKAYPEVNQSYYFTSYNISLPVATLIIVFPIFILLSWLNEKSYSADPAKKQIGVRRWLTYITLFVAGIILVGDLVTVLYKFLNGQDFTTAFILKALVVLGVTSLVFGYYIQDIREKIPVGRKKMWAIVVAIIILGAIILGFSVIGSPRTQRLIRYDDQKVSDLQNIQYSITNYWQKKGYLPSKLADINDPISGVSIPMDLQNSTQYEYSTIGANSFRICATFNLENSSTTSYPKTRPVAYPGDSSLDYWYHKAGHVCFDRTIDPKLYPVYKNQ